MRQFVTDTHPLVWYMTEDPRLPLTVRRIFRKHGIVIPCIVFFELLYLAEKKKIPVDFGNFLTLVASAKNYRIEPLCLPIIEKSREIPREKVVDPWDRLIIATSQYLDLPLLSRDESLREIGLEVIW